MALTDKLTAIGEAIRSKTGTTDLLTLDGMVTAIEGIETGGGTDEASVVAAIIDGSITEIRNDRVTSIRKDAFSSYKNLTSADFPQVTNIGANAFYFCSALTTVNFPQVTSIGDSAFNSCTKLTTANCPKVTSLGEAAFDSNSMLTSADFPQVTSIGTSAFNNCYKLTTVNFPQVTSIGSKVFNGCSALKTADFLQAKSINANAFYGCRVLITLVLRSEAVATLANTNAFTNCHHLLGTTNSSFNPDGLHDGYVYVPSVLVESYKAATNWSSLDLQFRALEDYTVDGTVTGELDETKI